MSSLIMNGIASCEGERVNSLRVGRMVRRNPQPSYTTSCQTCGAESSATHGAIRSGAARCHNSSCGKAGIERRREAESRNSRMDSRALAEQLRRESAEAAREASIRRMESETEGYQLPKPIRATSATPVPLSAREQQSIRERRAELEAEQQAERERIEAPIRAAEARVLETHRALAKVERARLLAEVPDPDFFVDPSVSTVRMSAAQAREFNAKEFREYRQSHPELFMDDGLIDQLSSYFDKNQLRIISASMIHAVVTRFANAHLLPDRPEPEQPEPEMQPEPIEPPQPQTFVGRDYETGRDKEFTAREVERMTSTEFRRAFRVNDDLRSVFARL